MGVSCALFINFKMAKSMKSKHKHKMSAIKRAKNAPKELARLKKMLGVDGKQFHQDHEMKETCVIKTSKEILQTKEATAVPMECKGNFDEKTFLDSNGQYPEWMNQRKMRKLRKQRNNLNKIKKAKSIDKGYKMVTRCQN